VAVGQDASAVVAEGQRLFEKQWVAGEPAQVGGDGLGPVFNHVSCAACHRQGGLGGGGPIDVNAVMLSVEVPKLPEAPQRKQFLETVRATHPGFLSSDGDISPNVILHRFGTDPRYSALRVNLVGKDIPFQPSDEQRETIQRDFSRLPVRPIATVPGLKLVTTERNTPALFGARLIDSIGDADLFAMAAAQRLRGEVSGRVPPVNLDKAGRFGWRGQIEHLNEFVLGACANELGLEVPGHSQPLDPQRPDYRPVGLDMSAAQCQSLTAYVASLSSPRIVLPIDQAPREAAVAGRQLFHQVGCGACHVEKVAQVEGIYSDLLLHDLGPALGDPVLAQPTLVAKSQHLTSREHVESLPSKPVSVQGTPPQYYGGSSITGATFASGKSAATHFRFIDQKTAVQTDFGPLPTNLAQEWRTPPLWGMADSAPYLHDGRAATALEAIALHGGEAEKCTQRFFALPVADRLAVLEFLNCLRAP
jgi:CxxC motif-containing protein (DUF1111 family)